MGQAANSVWERTIVTLKPVMGKGGVLPFFQPGPSQKEEGAAEKAKLEENSLRIGVGPTVLGIILFFLMLSVLVRYILSLFILLSLVMLIIRKVILIYRTLLYDIVGTFSFKKKY